MDIVGEWEGYYQFGEGYTLPEFGEKVNITILFEEDGDEFIGTVDEDASQFTEATLATAKGACEGSLISFIKSYKGEDEPKEIEYEGYIDEQNDAMYGSWVIEEIQEDEEGQYEAVCTGTWLLRRVK